MFIYISIHAITCESIFPESQTHFSNSQAAEFLEHFLFSIFHITNKGSPHITKFIFLIHL